MEEKIKRLMCEIFRLKEEEITDSLTMRDIETWDSLKHMELVVAIEEEFGIELNADEIVAMQSVKDIERILKERGIEG